MSRTAATERAYLDRAYGLVDEARRQGLSPSRWLAAKAPAVSKRTFRLYRAALYHWAMSLGMGREAAEIHAVSPMSAGTELPGRRTSALKRKGLGPSVLARLCGSLRSRRSVGASVAADMLTAGVVVGLRPSEWAYAHLVDGVLVVRNAKATNGRAHGETRTLVLPRSEGEEVEAIRRLLRIVSQDPGAWPRVYASARRALHRETSAVAAKGKKRPALYSARHQFSSDLKLVASREEVAAAFGHATTDTAARHYGPRSKGRRGRPLAKPVDREVARIKRARPNPRPRREPRVDTE